MPLVHILQRLRELHGGATTTTTDAKPAEASRTPLETKPHLRLRTLGHGRRAMMGGVSMPLVVCHDMAMPWVACHAMAMKGGVPWHALPCRAMLCHDMAVA